MEAPLPRQQLIDALRRAAAVHDTKHLPVLPQPSGQRAVLQRVLPAECNAAEPLIERCRLRAELLHRPARRIRRQQIPERWLRRRTQHDRGAELRRERSHRRNARPQMRQRQHLRLVKNDDAVCQIVELAAAGRTVCVERLEQLHRRRHHDRHVPVFGGQCAAHLLRRRAVGEVKLHAAVVLEHVGGAENVAEYCGVLLDDRGVGNDVNYPLHPVRGGVAQREGK